MYEPYTLLETVVPHPAGNETHIHKEIKDLLITFTRYLCRNCQLFFCSLKTSRAHIQVHLIIDNPLR